MKSFDLQKLVLSKYLKGETSSKFFNDLNGSVILRTIQRWCKMVKEKGTIELRYSSGRSLTSYAKKKHTKGEKSFKSKKKSVSTNISPGDINFKRFSP